MTSQSAETASIASHSFVMPTPPPSTYAVDSRHSAANDHDELASLPSSSSGDSSETYTDSDADREWRESLQQLELLLTMVLVPYLGKYFGRKAAYWGWARFMEWKYPVQVEVTSPVAFKASGAVEVAASL